MIDFINNCVNFGNNLGKRKIMPKNTKLVSGINGLNRKNGKNVSPLIPLKTLKTS